MSRYRNSKYAYLPKLRLARGNPGLAFVMLAGLAFGLFSVVGSPTLEAQNLPNRFVRIRSSLPSISTNHTIGFSNPQGQDIGAVVFEYCFNSPFFNDACNAPPGLNLLGSSLSSQTGETGFSINAAASNANRIVLSRPAASLVSTTGSNYTLSGVVNPSTENQSVYVRISIYDDVDWLTANVVDYGSAVFRTSGSVTARGFVPPHLTFCVGISVALNCQATNGSYVGLGQLSTSQTRSGVSQFAGSTNDPTGYSVFIRGTTLTSGNDIIPGLTNANPSRAGQSQFGINLRANTSPSVGINRVGNGTAVPGPGYNGVNAYRFRNGDLVARANRSTDFNRFTVSYISNISQNQPGGRYSSTLTYVAVASF
jgi:hypothetical protein